MGSGCGPRICGETGELVGRCGLLSHRSQAEAQVEVAYLLSPRFWGRGLASEAARAVRDFGFRAGCSRLVSLIHVENGASKRVARAMGMTLERRTRFRGLDVELFSVSRAASPVCG